MYKRAYTFIMFILNYPKNAAGKVKLISAILVRRGHMLRTQAFWPFCMFEFSRSEKRLLEHV